MANSKAPKSKISIALLYRKQLIDNITPAELHFLTLLLQIESKYSLPFFFQYPWIEDEAFYISDFYFPSSSITFELDGRYHNAPEQRLKDLEKTNYLKSIGIATYRLTNAKTLKLTLQTLVYLLRDKGVIK